MERRVLLAGRRVAPLGVQEITRATNTFLGLDGAVPTRHEPGVASAFRVDVDENGQQFGEVVFGPDIYPGPSIVDANSALSLTGAVAHELTHYHRWFDNRQLNEPALKYLDEALTSLEAALRYDQLSRSDVRQLMSDAVHRIQLFVNALPQTHPSSSKAAE